MTVVGDSSGERCDCNNIDKAVEFINKRPHEHYVIYNATDDLIKAVRERVRATIKKG